MTTRIEQLDELCRNQAAEIARLREALFPSWEVVVVARDVAEVAFEKSRAAGVSVGGSITAATHAVLDLLAGQARAALGGDV